VRCFYAPVHDKGKGKVAPVLDQVLCYEDVSCA